MTSFPVEPEQVTPGWLTEQLRAAGAAPSDAEITAFTTTSIGEGVGLLGLVVRVDLTWSGEAGPASVVIKFAHPVAANRAIAMNTRMYEREVTFFRDIAPLVRVAMPRCYSAAVDVESGRAIVMLEDLRGYRAGDQVEGCDAETAKAIIDAFVPLHVDFWDATDQPALATAIRVDPEYRAGFSPTPEATWPRCVAEFGHCLTDYVRDGIERYVANVRDLHGVMADRTQTLVHGDVRLDNVMFGTTPEHHDIVLIDWQAVMVSNPGQDLAYLVSQNVRTDERRAHEDELIAHYHGRLVERGVRGYSLEQCIDDYEVGVLYLLAYPIVVAGAFDPANERGRRLAEEFLGRSVQTVTDRQLFRRLPH